MIGEELLDAMSDSCGKRINVTLKDGTVYKGKGDLYESRFDNEDDDGPLAGQASFVVKIDEENGIMLYESQIEDIEVLSETEK